MHAPYDHAPVGDVAFRAEPEELCSTAHTLEDEARLADGELGARLNETAKWYEELAFDIVAIRNLPCTV